MNKFQKINSMRFAVYGALCLCILLFGGMIVADFSRSARLDELLLRMFETRAANDLEALEAYRALARGLLHANPLWSRLLAFVGLATSLIVLVWYHRKSAARLI